MARGLHKLVPMEASPLMAQLLRERQEVILDRWSERVRTHPIAHGLSREDLVDSLPQLIEAMAETIEHGRTLDASAIMRGSEAHATQRLGLGYRIGQLVAEYIDLRRTLEEGLADRADEFTPGAWCTLHDIIDVAVRGALLRFDRVRERKVEMLERVSSEPLTAPSLDVLLEQLLGVMADVAPEVDTVTILLREGDTLVVRASRGLEEEIHRGFVLPIGQGFAGQVAASRRPVLLRDAAHDPRVKSDVIRARGVKALYGVPLVQPDGELVGVAHMGSTTAVDFQDEDLLLFRALANRVTALIATRRTVDRLLGDEHQRERFVAVLAHDLRSPLTAVAGSAQMLLARGRLDEQDRRTAARIVRASQRMSRLIDDLLDFTRARVGQGIPLRTAWTDLAEVVRATVDEEEAGSPRRRVRLQSELRSRVCCDADRVAQVVSNVVGNALKHGPPDAPVDVRVVEEGDDAVVRVHNEGPPIPRELLPNVFDPFRRGARSGKPGVGLGLFIAQAVVVSHGGTLEVTSEPGEGTTFTVRLPKEGPSRRGEMSLAGEEARPAAG